MDALEIAKQVKKHNQIDIAIGVSAITPLFQEHASRVIEERLEDIYGKPYPPHYLWTIKMNIYGLRILNLRMRARNVLRSRPRISAALFLPLTFQPDCSSTRLI